MRRTRLALNKQVLALRRGLFLGLAAVLTSLAIGACGPAPDAPGTASVVSAPARVAHTSLGAVGYRVVGSGPPLVLIMGYGWNMEGWDPRLIHVLALHNRVVTEFQVRSDFPANQTGALGAFKAAVSEYPSSPTVSPGIEGIQDLAMGNWRTGSDAAGLKTSRISAPTLVADGSDDQLDPLANDRILVSTIHGSRLELYPDAGHAFLFQDWSRFAALVDSFLAG